MGLLQGPRLMAWTTKSPINHYVPLGCKALLGSVKSERTKQMEQVLNFQVPPEGLELVILLRTQY